MKTLFLGLAVAVLAGFGLQAAELTSHKAIYDVTIHFSRTGEDSGAGRMEQIWRRSCDGYVLEQDMAFSFRNAAGMELKMESRFNYLEDEAGRNYQFDATQFVNGQLVEESAGTAIRGSNDVPIVRFSRPERMNQILPQKAWFPTRLTLDLIDRLKAGETYFSELTFDGTSTNSLYRVSGLRLKDKHLAPLKAGDPGQGVLKDEPGWALDVAWYEMKDGQRIDSQPDYRVRMDMYGNGVSRELRFIYPDMEIASRLREIRWLDDPVCN